MYQVAQEQELTTPLIKKILNSFNTAELPKLTNYYNYYIGKQAIANKQATDEGKPNNKITVNYCNNIVNNYLGYITGKPIQYSNSDTNNFDEVLDILRYNDIVTEDSEFLRQALIYGIAFEINYIDEDGVQRIKIFDAKECVPVYDDTISQNLKYVIRFYKENLTTEEYNEDSSYIVEVYGDNFIETYRSTGTFSTFEPLSKQAHYYGQCPVTVFILNNDGTNIFDQVISLQDAYNSIMSNQADDFDSFCDAYLLLKGVTATDEDLSAMKRNRVLMLDNDNDATYLTKQAQDTTTVNMLTNIKEQIHKISNSPDFSDEKLLAQSGIAMRYKLVGFENTASNIEANMRKALQRRIENITSILHLTSDNEEAWRDITITFNRNLPIDLTEYVNIVNGLRGTVSQETLLSLLPFVKDVPAELEKVKAENESNMSLFSYGELNMAEQEEADKFTFGE